MTYTPPLNGGRINVTMAGNSTSAGAGYALASTGTLTLAGGNNITLSQNANAITISGGAGGGGVALYDGAASITSGTASFSDVNGVSFGFNGQTITGSVAAQTNQTIGLYGLGNTTQNSSTTLDARTLSFNGLGINTVGYSNGSIQISASQSVQTQNIVDMSIAGNSTSAGGGYALISSGTAILAGGNNITLSQNAQSITISGPNTAAQTVQPGIASIQASNTTYTSGKVIFSNANGMSFGSSAGSAITASYTVPAAQTNQSVGLYAVSNTTVNTSGTADARSISFAGAGGVSVQATNGSVLISGGAGAFSAGMSTGGNTLGTSGTVSNALVFAGGNNVTLSQATGAGGNTLTISAPNFATATSPFQIQFAGNTSGTMSTVTTGAVQFAGGNNITLSQSQQSVTISGAADYTYSYFNPQDAYLQVAGQIGQKTLMFQPTPAPNVQFDRIMLPINYSNASNSSNSFTVSAYVGVYTRNVSTLSLLFSVSTSYNITNSGTVGSYSQYGGMRLLSVGVGANTLITQGQYQIGIMSITTTGGGAGMSMSNMVASQINSSFSGIFGAASAVSAQYTRGLGWMSVTTGAMPNSVAMSDMVGNSSAALRQPLFYFVSGTV